MKKNYVGKWTKKYCRKTKLSQKTLKVHDWKRKIMFTKKTIEDFCFFLQKNASEKLEKQLDKKRI